MNKTIRKPLVRINDRFGKTFGFKLKRVPYSRPSTLKALEIFNDKPIRVIEIGCAAGNNTLDVLKQLNVSEYIIIDPYEKIDNSYDDYSIARLALMRKQSRKKLRNYEDKITWIYDTSSKAIERINGSADYIYVDGDHRYSQVLSDMDNYYNLLADRFVFGGHDIDQPDVAKAFVDFIANKAITNYEIKDSDWIVYHR